MKKIKNMFCVFLVLCICASGLFSSGGIPEFEEGFSQTTQSASGNIVRADQLSPVTHKNAEELSGLRQARNLLEYIGNPSRRTSEQILPVLFVLALLLGLFWNSFYIRRLCFAHILKSRTYIIQYIHDQDGPKPLSPIRKKNNWKEMIGGKKHEYFCWNYVCDRGRRSWLADVV